MTYNKSTGRNYKRDYKKFQSSEKAKKDRAARNKRRRKAEREGSVKKGDGKDIHHKGNRTWVMSKSKNRGMREKSRLPRGSRKK
jgi:hypothetical protein